MWTWTDIEIKKMQVGRINLNWIAMQSGWLLASLMSTSFMETRRLTEASCWITLVRSKSSYTPQFIITDLPAKVTFSSGLEQQQISITLSFWRHLWFCCQWAFNRSLLPFWLLGIPGYLNQVRGWDSLMSEILLFTRWQVSMFPIVKRLAWIKITSLMTWLVRDH